MCPQVRHGANAFGLAVGDFLIVGSIDETGHDRFAHKCKTVPSSSRWLSGSFDLSVVSAKKKITDLLTGAKRRQGSSFLQSGSFEVLVVSAKVKLPICSQGANSLLGLTEN